MSVSRTVVAGLGASGLAAACYLSARGDEVLVIDSRAAPPALDELRVRAPDVRIQLDTLDVRWLDGASRLVLSPGLASDLPLVAQARERGVEVIGELELFARVAPAPVVAVTGSNGKSTVVTLASQLLAARGLGVLVGGNLGPPALELLDAPAPDVYVLEVSSFQLETTESLHPRVAAVLNVSADHLDRHRTLEAYAAIKSQLLIAADNAVYNFDDRLVSLMASRHPNAVGFSVQTELEQGWSVVNVRHDGTRERWLARDRQPLIASSQLSVGGAVGEANALAALALTEQFAGPVGTEIGVLRQFEGLPHRVRTIATRAGVTFVDDSKGTNVGATSAAIASMTGPVVLIAGGLGKGADFGPLADASSRRVRAAVLLGQAADDIDAVLAPVVRTVRATTLEEAVRFAAALAEPGDTVLLSPACASQDMFRDYRERGEQFALAVARLPG
jgi:UDP-N-acetylmuramoylalanine--D-glutamate ligase